MSDSGTVSADGVRVVDSSGNGGIDQAVISAIKNAGFTPAYQNGHTVSAIVLLPVVVEVPANLPEK